MTQVRSRQQFESCTCHFTTVVPSYTCSPAIGALCSSKQEQKPHKQDTQLSAVVAVGLTGVHGHVAHAGVHAHILSPSLLQVCLRWPVSSLNQQATQIKPTTQSLNTHQSKSSPPLCWFHHGSTPGCACRMRKGETLV